MIRQGHQLLIHPIHCQKIPLILQIDEEKHSKTAKFHLNIQHPLKKRLFVNNKRVFHQQQQTAKRKPFKSDTFYIKFFKRHPTQTTKQKNIKAALDVGSEKEIVLLFLQENQKK